MTGFCWFIIVGSGALTRIPNLLPQTFYNTAGTLSRRYQSWVYLNRIYIRATSHNATFYPDAVDAAHNWFRYVLIPGGVDISALERSGVNLNNYDEVVQALDDLR